jgi:hypothetical protein
VELARKRLDWRLVRLAFIYAPPTDSKDKRKAGKCFALIIQSLSPVITSCLPGVCRNPLDPKSTLLWTHLEKTFSAEVGARQAILLQELFENHPGRRGSDAALIQAHSQLKSSGENISDKMLAYAMTIALPESGMLSSQVAMKRLQQHNNSGESVPNVTQ